MRLRRGEGRVDSQLGNRSIAAQLAGNDALERSVSVPDPRGGPASAVSAQTR
jgi:hypothetical protein